MVAQAIIYVCGAILVAIGLWFYSLFKGVNFWPLAVSILNYEISLWKILIVAFLLVILLKVTQRLKTMRVPSIEETSSDYILYDPTPKPQPKASRTSRIAEGISEMLTTAFDSSESKPADYLDFGEPYWNPDTKKLEGTKGTGRFTFYDSKNLLEIKRTNGDGRYNITLKNYYLNGVADNIIRENTTGNNPGNFLLTYSARAIRGKHRLTFALKRPESKEWVSSFYTDIHEPEWLPQIVSFLVSADENFYIEIQNTMTDAVTGVVQIKELLIKEQK